MDEKNISNNSNDDGDGGGGGSIPFSAILDERPWEEAVPRTVLTELYNGDAALTRAIWLLILRNSGLRELTFELSWPKVGFKTVRAPESPFPLHYTLHSESAVFLTAILSRLSTLRHLEIGCGAADYLLCQLAAIMPQLEIFIYIEITNFEPKEIELAVLHRALKRLELKAFVNVDQLRGACEGFPGTDSLFDGRDLRMDSIQWLPRQHWRQWTNNSNNGSIGGEEGGFGMVVHGVAHDLQLIL